MFLYVYKEYTYSIKENKMSFRVEQPETRITSPEVKVAPLTTAAAAETIKVPVGQPKATDAPKKLTFGEKLEKLLEFKASNKELPKWLKGLANEKDHPVLNS